MEHTDKLDQLLLTWCDNEMERVRIGIKSMEEGSLKEANKQNIHNYHTELSMYQSFRNKILSFTYNPPTING